MKDELWKVFRSGAYAAYLGGALNMLGFGIKRWQWWAVMVPVIVLVFWREDWKKERDL